MEGEEDADDNGMVNVSVVQSKKDRAIKAHIVLDDEVENELVGWFRDRPYLYDKGNRNFKDKDKKEGDIAAKAQQINLKFEDLRSWFYGMRTMYGKFTKMHSQSSGRIPTHRQK